MKYFETKHEKDSAKVTLLITLILLLMIFVMGPQYMDPPEEYGVAVNFGNSNVGQGRVQPKKPVKSEPKQINEPTQPEVSKSEPTKSSEVKEEVLTQEDEEAIAIQKQKEAEAKAKAIAEAKAKAEAEQIAKEKREQEEKKKKLDALIGGINKSDGSQTGSEGNDNTPGDKGQLDGNPYASSYFGDPGTGSGGVGYGLNGRGAPTRQIYKQDCNESGLVVVQIEVDRNGRVIKATPGVKGTTNNAICLLEPAKKIALSHKWRPDSKAPARQIGFVSVNFNLGQ
ncbi:energy transducer TonB [Seonamhaeicola aphaedonensis]|uniref:Outer membrane transport energization protein TonB n=1 Tax=Seonamhaeicola aphaedonensis TaxID=1461338 RepID=A0A3D9H645_9FLAO|nr:energy transducer TonB [Seonamhaeicola aphaedonensis]RED44631.1 outer membrane transport energization protein TonB [Seonamhaeicola aphaedonensis]